MDRRTPAIKAILEDWLDTVLNSNDSTFFKPSDDSNERKDEGSSKEKHFEVLTSCFANPFDAGLGPIPNRLAEVLADIAMASPAVTSLRAIRKCYEAADYDKLLFAFDLAAQFLVMFNKPESIASVRLCTDKDFYWRRVLEYCRSGCLQSVLDEFFHVLRPDAATIWEMFSRVVDSMNLGTSSIKVDDLQSFLKDERRNMRCHYAVDLGNQRVKRMRVRIVLQESGSISTRHLGRLYLPPLPSVRKDSTFTRTAARSCIGICRATQSILSSVKDASTASKGLSSVSRLLRSMVHS